MKKIFIILGVVLLIAACICVAHKYFISIRTTNNNDPIKSVTASTAKTINSQFNDNFTKDRVVEEAGSMNKSSDPNWWVNSGGRMIVNNGVGETIQGSLSTTDPEYIKYASTNPSETDNGLHPQNIFRLVTRTTWNSYQQQAYFYINHYNTSSSQNRQGSNGLFLFNRYQSGQTLYYTGIRVDGTVSIKKKYNGTYYDMANRVFLKGNYNRTSNPNLLPLHQWIGVRSDVSTINNKVTIKVYVDIGKTGKWILAAQATDDGKTYKNTPEILKAGYAGIRTDFMDVMFANYSIIQQN